MSKVVLKNVSKKYDKKKVINGKNITAGDVLIGIKSTGVHSNGYSLVRKLFGDSDKAALEFVWIWHCQTSGNRRKIKQYSGDKGETG